MRCAVLLLVAAVCCHAVTDKEFKDFTKSINDKVNSLKSTMTKTVQVLARQLSLQQLYVEEQARYSGNSGVKVVRLSRAGTRSYYQESYTGGQRVLGSHNHPDFQDTVGMGELVAVLNGVEFRTRHNDYRLVMPHRYSKKYGATEEIPKPAVPQRVLSKKTVTEQAAEMREWFKAWQNQDSSKRDYRKFFKPVLCYLEGMWTQADMNKIDEPFASDRHSLDAASFFALQDTIKFAVNTGRKSTKENLAFLPTTVNGFDKDGIPQLAQWNYKILCHPLKRDVPLSRFRMLNDITSKLSRGKSDISELDRSARFELYHAIDNPAYKYEMYYRDGFDRDNEGTFLDQLMGEIPGKDNYPGNILDDAWGESAYPYNSKVTPLTRNVSKPLNAGYYHRVYKLGGNDAMGASIRRRGFHDNNLYTALTTNDKVVGQSTHKCTRNYACNSALIKKGNKCQLHNCKYWTQRASFAIPLEIIYMTPLMSWNPYKIKIHANKHPELRIPILNGRNGGLSKDKAYNGASRIKYYITPAEFFAGDAKRVDSADTAIRPVGVLDQRGNIQKVVSSGVSILTQDIAGLGQVRIRYPIPLTQVSGSTTQKELDALKDLTLYPKKFHKFFPGAMGDNGTIEEVFSFSMARSTKDPPGPHYHTIELTSTQLRQMKYEKKFITVITDTSYGHDHELELQYGVNKKNPSQWWIAIRKCDGEYTWKQKDGMCWDKHARGGIYCTDCINNTFPVQ